MANRVRVLVVDDDAVLRAAIRRMLAATYDVVECADGGEAVARVVAGDPFDAVVMDLEMPRLNGRDALARLEALAPDLAARTVMMSGGSGDDELRAWFSGLDVARVLAKPFSKRALVDIVQRILAV